MLKGFNLFDFDAILLRPSEALLYASSCEPRENASREVCPCYSVAKQGRAAHLSLLVFFFFFFFIFMSLYYAKLGTKDW